MTTTRHGAQLPRTITVDVTKSTMRPAVSTAGYFGVEPTTSRLGAIEVLVGNGGPAADAGPDRAIEATGPDGALVTLSPTVTDPDGDPLTVLWTGPFGTVSGETVRVQLPIGTHVLTLHASDPCAAADDDEVVITVRDSIPPSLIDVPTT